MQKSLEISKTPSPKLGTRVRIPWRQGDTILKWDETCAWALEQFGLPGDRFTYHPTEEYMDFYFINEADAIHFSLRWL
jgi:hypothetical protein